MNFSCYQKIKKSDYEAVAGPDWPSFEIFSTHTNINQQIYNEIDQMLDFEEFDNQAFCVLPFYGIEYPNKVSCCLLDMPHDLALIKSQMLQGKRPDACNRCWRLEDVGIQSDRQVKNNSYEYYTNKSIKDTFAECQQGQNKITHYKVDSSNVCNATCATCNSYYSTAWSALEQRQGITPNRWFANLDKNYDINYASAKSISFRGGEPLLSDKNFDIMENLLSVGNQDCMIGIVTNGSIMPSPSRLKILESFTNLNICFSIDGTGPVFEYLRFPLEWNKLIEHINFWKQKNVTLGVSYTVSNLNVFYHAQTTQWFKDNKLPYLVNPVYEPSWFRPSALPQQVKQQICKTSGPEIEKLLGSHTDQDDIDYLLFLEKIQLQDSWKKISLNDYLPDLANILAPQRGLEPRTN